MTRRETSTYLVRQRLRVASAELTKHVTFGMALASLLLGVGAVRYFLVPGATDAVWAAAIVVGAAALLVTLVVPSLWRWPERLMQAFGTLAGWYVFGAILTVIYVFLFWPIGALVRMRQGTHPVYAWTSERPRALEGWRPKTVAVVLPDSSRSGRAGLLMPLFVVWFFARRGQYLLLPSLVVLLVVGLVLFFIHTSGLAPFIYTLF